MKNIALEVMLYEIMFKRTSGALVFKIGFTIKPKFKKHDDPLLPDYLSKMYQKMETTLFFNHNFALAILSCFPFHCPHNASKKGRQNSKLESLKDTSNRWYLGFLTQILIFPINSLWSWNGRILLLGLNFLGLETAIL